MGRMLVLDGVKITDTSAPILPTIDRILPESGALIFIDPSHPANPWPSGAPVHATDYPNLVQEQASAMSGATAAEASPQLYIGPDFLAKGGLAERTTKGGLHIVGSRSSMESGQSRNVKLGFATKATPITTYLENNLGHSYYFAAWGRWTRPVGDITSGGWIFSRAENTNKAGSFYTRSGVGEVAYPTGAPKTNWEATNAASAVAGPFFVDMAQSSIPTPAAIHMDAMSYVPSGMTVSASPGHIFYGYYLEDLTVSGRTYEQVNALVRAKFDRDVMEPGGRYYGDTFTNPNTIP